MRWAWMIRCECSPREVQWQRALRVRSLQLGVGTQGLSFGLRHGWLALTMRGRARIARSSSLFRSVECLDPLERGGKDANRAISNITGGIVLGLGFWLKCSPCRRGYYSFFAGKWVEGWGGWAGWWKEGSGLRPRLSVVQGEGGRERRPRAVTTLVF